MGELKVVSENLSEAQSQIVILRDEQDVLRDLYEHLCKRIDDFDMAISRMDRIVARHTINFEVLENTAKSERSRVDELTERSGRADEDTYSRMRRLEERMKVHEEEAGKRFVALLERHGVRAS
jgi:chromosome segregation ATPase